MVKQQNILTVFLWRGKVKKGSEGREWGLASVQHVMQANTNALADCLTGHRHKTENSNTEEKVCVFVLKWGEYTGKMEKNMYGLAARESYTVL